MTTICRDLLLPSQPLAEKRIDESVVSVKPIEYLRFLDLGESHLYRGGVVGCGGGEEFLGAYRLSANCAAILERVHSSILYRVWYYSILYYTILHNAERDTTFRIQPQVGKLASDLFLIHNAVNA